MLLIVLDMPPSSHASPAKRFCAQQQLSSALCYAALGSTFSVIMQLSIHICSRPQAWQPGVAPVCCSVVVPHWNHAPCKTSQRSDMVRRATTLP